ncbi:Gfo/Idh/MocA family oxidoreductase [bacterium]|nr:Gfo/Idh/MocA family oxidoreductase [bacterium]
MITVSGPSARIAFVGAGNHSTESLYPNIAHIPEFDLVGVCDLDAEKAERAAHLYGAPQWFTDVATMLAEVKPEGVCICGMPDMHHAVGLQVLRAGVPLFTEKPPAFTAAEAAELVQAAEASGVWGMVAFMKRVAPANVVARELIDRGSAPNASSAGGSPARAGEAARATAEGGAGTVGDIFGGLNSLAMIHGSGPYTEIRRMLLFNAIHMLDLARFFAGDVAEVFCHRSPAGSAVQALSISFRFVNGVVGQLNMNSSVTWRDCFEQVYLSGKGAAMLIDASREVQVMSGQSRFADAPGVDTAGWGSRYYVSGNLSGWTAGGHYTRGYHGELQHFARAVLGQVAPAATLVDGLRAMELIEAIMQSTETGQPVSL